MEAKHTKGPWRENEDLDGIRLRILDESGDIIICQCFHANGIEERKYNARLISSAPELLEALEDLVDRYWNASIYIMDVNLDKSSTIPKCINNCINVVDNARNTIAKAKGEA